MAGASLPDGAIFAIGTLGSALTVSALTNASPPVATSASHGLVDGDIVLLTSGWTDLTERAFKVDELSASTFSLVGEDTTNTTTYPTGTGAGTAKKVTAWTSLPKVTTVSTSGGEMQFANYALLAENIARQIPSQANALTYTLNMLDDPTDSGYVAVKAAAKARTLTVLRCLLPSGSFILYVGYVSLRETPTLTKGSVMEVAATFSVNGMLTRYAS